jgi:hypothetical membrane protein
MGCIGLGVLMIRCVVCDIQTIIIGMLFIGGLGLCGIGKVLDCYAVKTREGTL